MTEARDFRSRRYPYMLPGDWTLFHGEMVLHNLMEAHPALGPDSLLRGKIGRFIRLREDVRLQLQDLPRVNHWLSWLISTWIGRGLPVPPFEELVLYPSPFIVL